MEVEKKLITSAYYKQHKICPSCKNPEGRITTSLVGYVYEPDENYVSCSCGWHGITHDLLPPF